MERQVDDAGVPKSEITTTRNGNHFPLYRGLIGAHVLSEFVYCERAGLIAKQQPDPEGIEEPRLGPRLDYFLGLKEKELVALLERNWQILKFATPVSLIGLLLIWLCALLFDRRVMLMAGFLPLIWGVAEIASALPVFIAGTRALREFRSAPKLPANLVPTERMRVNWWSLRNSGFDCQKLHDPYESPDRAIAGKPWRVLTTPENRRIPVIWRPRGSASYGMAQAVRLAAYCDLIERCENAESPFGVILYRGTTECVLIPITKELRSRLRESITDARQTLARLGENSGPPPAPTDRRCLRCPLGKPHRYRPGSSETRCINTSLKPRTFIGYRADGSRIGEFHSECGDHFAWIPPHEDADRLQLHRQTETE